MHTLKRTWKKDYIQDLAHDCVSSSVAFPPAFEA